MDECDCHDLKPILETGLHIALTVPSPRSTVLSVIALPVDGNARVAVTPH